MFVTCLFESRQLILATVRRSVFTNQEKILSKDGSPVITVIGNNDNVNTRRPTENLLPKEHTWRLDDFFLSLTNIMVEGTKRKKFHDKDKYYKCKLFGIGFPVAMNRRRFCSLLALFFHSFTTFSLVLYRSHTQQWPKNRAFAPVLPSS